MKICELISVQVILSSYHFILVIHFTRKWNSFLHIQLFQAHSSLNFLLFLLGDAFGKLVFV